MAIGVCFVIHALGDGGQAPALTTPGLGVTINDRELERFTVAQRSFQVA